ncbi:MAG: peptidylprolyl isomerase [Acidimicrobiales bacterium]
MVTQNQKRARQKQGRQARQAAMLAARRKRSRRNRLIVSAFLALVLVGSVAILVGGGSSEKKAATDNAACPEADGSSPRQAQFTAPPSTCIDASRTYTAEINTNKGIINVALDPKAAPNAVNSFVFLARNHFFDGLNFHRVVPGFVLQGGDPEGTGAGGPGYTFADELPQAGQYKIGSLAMANSGPDTNGSQFFIISGPQGAGLDPKYSLFGEVTSGLDVVSQIDALGNAEDPSGKPKEPITMSSVTIKET